jgi:hypothetical protein
MKSKNYFTAAMLSIGIAKFFLAITFIQILNPCLLVILFVSSLSFFILTFGRYVRQSIFRAVIAGLLFGYVSSELSYFGSLIITGQYSRLPSPGNSFWGVLVIYPAASLDWLFGIVTALCLNIFSRNTNKLTDQRISK